jgi:3'(2'), 5'-bisphosphate nucleotidase
MTLIQVAVEIARKAGAEILAHYARSRQEVHSKADFSPVTSADLAADEILRTDLPKALPHSEFVSEESIDTILSAEKAMELLKSAGWCWLVDPLDGTREFLSGTDDFTVNIALVKNGDLHLGVMYAPAREILYFGEKSHGSFRVLKNRSPEKLRGKPFNKKNIEALVSRHHTQGEEQFLRALIPGITVNQVGSALKYGYLAQGAADFSFRRSPTSLWDTAAAQCILEEAGGAIWDADGQKLSITQGSLKNRPFLAVSDANIPTTLKLELLASLSQVKSPGR